MKLTMIPELFPKTIRDTRLPAPKVREDDVQWQITVYAISNNLYCETENKLALQYHNRGGGKCIGFFSRPGVTEDFTERDIVPLTPELKIFCKQLNITYS